MHHLVTHTFIIYSLTYPTYLSSIHTPIHHLFTHIFIIYSYFYTSILLLLTHLSIIYAYIHSPIQPILHLFTHSSIICSHFYTSANTGSNFSDHFHTLFHLSTVMTCDLTFDPFVCRLSAFVAKSFRQAQSYIFIDSAHIEKTLSWIISRQNKDGSFTEPSGGRVIHTNMQVSKSNTDIN